MRPISSSSHPLAPRLSAGRRLLARTAGAIFGVLAMAGGCQLLAQTRYASGQNVVPVFEGWERNADGSFNMVFGYMNRNYEQELDLPVGPTNTIEPGQPDQGQPTHFYVRRQQFAFKVRVPKDWGKKDLIWTLKVGDKTEKAYGSLLPFWELGLFVYQENRGSTADITDTPEPNEAPTIKIATASPVAATTGAPVALVADVADDGHPAPRRRATPPAAPTSAARAGGASPSTTGGAPPTAGRGAAGSPAADPAAAASAAATVRRDSDGAVITQTGTPGPGGTGPRRENPLTQAIVRLDPGVSLGVTWIVYRGSTKGVTFVPQRVAVANGKASSSVQFAEPGTYTLRAYADDGVLITPADIIVNVAPAH